jgi:hypothetical protein
VNLFGPRKVVDDDARAQLARLRDELVSVQSVVRQIETEAIAMHDQVRRWMRRAVAAERSVSRNQEPPAVNGHGQATPAMLPPAALSRLNLRGARNRIAARRQLEMEQEFLRRVSEGAPALDALPAAPAALPEAKESTEGD